MQALRADRYRLQSVARGLINARGVAEGFEFPWDWHRSAKCVHAMHGVSVGVCKSKKHGGAFFTGLVVCGNVFACTVCAAKVQERRRVEIAEAFDWAYSNGDKVIMVTFTFPHYRWDNLSELLSKQSDAYKRLRAGNPWKKICESIGYKGLIRSMEVTHGDNGWHPHTHEAWIVSNDADVEKLRKKVAARWFRICCRVGLATPEQEMAFFKHSVQITDQCRTSEYLAKQDSSGHWGADREIAKGASKQSMKNKGRHPFALLDDFSKEGAEHDVRAGSLFIEFIDAMRGKSSVFWSRNLKKKVGLLDKSDQEIAKEQEDSAFWLSRLIPKQWKWICRLKAKAVMLDVAETKGAIGLHTWLEKNVNHRIHFDQDEVDPLTGEVFCQRS